MHELKTRLLLGGIAAALLAVFLWLLPYGWMSPVIGVAVATVAALALWEYYKLAQANGYLPAVVWGIVLGIFYVGLRWIHTQGYFGVGVFDRLAMGGGLMVIVFCLFLRHISVHSHALGSVAISAFGILYVVFPLSLLLDVLYGFPTRYGADGRWWFLFLIAVTVVTDMGGYFAGQLFGNHPLAPRLSPNKTWEGAVGGLVFGTAVAILLSIWAPIPLWQVVILGVLLSIVGQVGDLAESLFKRDANVKDSSALPGLGGVLDVVDSLLFNIPLVYLAEQAVYGTLP
jgi:phosphatidate cytidylyltransferase